MVDETTVEHLWVGESFFHVVDGTVGETRLSESIFPFTECFFRKPYNIKPAREYIDSFIVTTG